MSIEYSKEFLDLLNSVDAKRPRTVIQHILQHGFITSQELKETYGYNHPPRAARDVREHGIPLVTYKVTGTDGRKIGAYRFGDPTKSTNSLSKVAGRTLLSKVLKQALIDKYGSKCFVYSETMDKRLLQVDHRVPYEIDGEPSETDIEAFMLLSPSANRAKSWSCEHCGNWSLKDPVFCISCFWASPKNYDHIAGNYQRVISIVFTGDEIEDYYQLIDLVGLDGAQDVIKRLIHEHLE